MVVLLFENESQRVCYRPGGRDWPQEVSEPEEDQEEDREGVQEAEPGGRRLADQLQGGLPSLPGTISTYLLNQMKSSSHLKTNVCVRLDTHVDVHMI